MQKESNSDNLPTGKSIEKSWTRTYVLVLLFNGLLIILFYILGHYLNII